MRWVHSSCAQGYYLPGRVGTPAQILVSNTYPERPGLLGELADSRVGLENTVSLEHVLVTKGGGGGRVKEARQKAVKTA